MTELVAGEARPGNFVNFAQLFREVREFANGSCFPAKETKLTE